MDNNNIDKTQEQDKEKSFITEKIKPKTRRKVKKVLEVCGFALLAAVIIGFVSRIVFVLSEDPVNKILGVEEKIPDQPIPNQIRSEVRLSMPDDEGRISPSIAGIPSPSPEPEKVPTQEADLTPSPSPSPSEPAEQQGNDEEKQEKDEEKQEEKEEKAESGEEKTVVPVTHTPEITEDETTEKNEQESEENDPMKEYSGIVGGLKDLYASVSESVVTIRAFSSGVNWLDENIETHVDGTGVVLGENGVELLVMTSNSKTETADRLEVILPDGFNVEGSVFLSDPVLDIAIVAVNLDKITTKEKSELRSICIGDSSTISVGDSIMAAGMPDGYSGSMAYGFVSAVDRKCYVQDGVVDVFATGLPYHSTSDAVIVNMSGEMVGIISHYAENNEDDKITTCVAINSIRDILIGLLNGKSPIRPGIRAEDMPGDVLASMGLENGIYVNEVVTSSPAEAAGLKKGDVIIEMDGTPINSVRDMMEYLISGTDRALISTKYYRGSLREEPFNTVGIEFITD
ncbi:MAG: S1C family serine protease [Lachnospiraceae bacterium]|nr:S1C family serine protease [Lachnospiraceae bacterium]